MQIHLTTFILFHHFIRFLILEISKKKTFIIVSYPYFLIFVHLLRSQAKIGLDSVFINFLFAEPKYNLYNMQTFTSREEESTPLNNERLRINKIKTNASFKGSRMRKHSFNCSGHKTLDPIINFMENGQENGKNITHAFVDFCETIDATDRIVADERMKSKKTIQTKNSS